MLSELSSLGVEKGLPIKVPPTKVPQQPPGPGNLMRPLFGLLRAGFEVMFFKEEGQYFIQVSQEGLDERVRCLTGLNPVLALKDICGEVGIERY